MKRSSLNSDPANTAAWQARSRAKALRRTHRTPTSRSTLKARQGLKRARPKRRVTTPPDVWAAVLARDGGLCVWSKYLGRRVKADCVHHLLPKGAGGWPEYVGTRENLVSMQSLAHLQHEFSPNDRLPWAALPDECREFLMRVAVVDARAARLIRTRYPGAML